MEMMRMLVLSLLTVITTASYAHAGLSVIQFHRIN